MLFVTNNSYFFSVIFIVALVIIHGEMVDKNIISNQSELLIRNDSSREVPGFLLLMPRLLLANHLQTICVTLHGCATPAKLDFIVKQRKSPDFHQNYHIEHEYSCFKFNLKRNISGRIDAQVRIECSNAISISARSLDPITVWNPQPLILFDTDRAIYRAGDKIHARLLVLDRNTLRPTVQQVGQPISLKNPMGVAVTVWQNLPLKMGLAHFEHTLESDAIEGKWSVESVIGDVIHPIYVLNHYIKSRFRVVLNHPKMLLWTSDSIPINVCALYHYGRPIKGTVFLRLSNAKVDDLQIQRMLEVDSSGCANFTIASNEVITSQSDAETVEKISISATIAEFGTDRIEQSTASIRIVYQTYEMYFDRNLDTFQPGVIYIGRLHFRRIHQHWNSTNMEQFQICYLLSIRKSWNLYNNRQCSNFTVALAWEHFVFSIAPLKNSVIQIQIEAKSLSNNNVSASHLVVRHYSPTGSYLHLRPISRKPLTCRDYHSFQIDFNASGRHSSPLVHLYYVVKIQNMVQKFRRLLYNTSSISSRGNPEVHLNTPQIGGSKPHKFQDMNPPSQHHITIKFKLNDNALSSHFDLFVYNIGSKGEVIAAVLKNVETVRCPRNQLKIEWERTEQPPGSMAQLQLQTPSDCVCSISATDKGNQWLNGVDYQMKSRSSSLLDRLLRQLNSNYGAVNLISDRRSCSRRNRRDLDSERNQSRVRRFIYPFAEDFDAYDMFNKFEAVVLTNFDLVTKPCYTGPAIPFHANPDQAEPLTTKYIPQNEDEQPIDIRSYFPETWLWELVSIPSKNKGRVTKLRRQLPDSITSWQTDVLCVSNAEGLGWEPAPKEISAFQPFFIDVLTPKSLKQGETLYLHVVLYNYLNYSLPIRMMLRSSPGLEVVQPQSRSTLSFCAPTTGTVTHIFPLKARGSFGLVNVTVIAEVDASYPGQCGPDIIVNRRDVVFRSMHIEHSGYRFDSPKTALLCAEGNATNVTWSLQQQPRNVTTTKLLLNADLLGRALSNFDRLLVTVPNGCGEQIMATMAPNLQIFQYLESVHRLDGPTRQRIRRNLKIGYQRILNYAHRDGSFSAFGQDQDSKSSMFLTAFVLRTLKQASHTASIYVDANVVRMAATWIFGHQLENGCFPTMQHVFQDMGGATARNSTATLTAYVIIALLQSNIEIPNRVTTNAKYCIRGHFDLDKYRLAISAYALLLVGWTTEANRMLEKLFEIAEYDDYMLWWSEKGQARSVATDIEITSYVLLAVLQQNSKDHLAKMHSIVRWLMSQSNANGGFTSTQDTVVALEALTKYSRYIMTNGRPLDLHVTISSNVEAALVAIHFQAKDTLLARQTTLDSTKATSEITTTVTGNGCLLVQMIQTSYVETVTRSEDFLLNLTVRRTAMTNASDPNKLQSVWSSHQLTPCFNYTGSGGVVNMAILEIWLPSGYQVDKSSIYTTLIRNDSKLGKFEEFDNKLIMYLTKLDNTEICFNLTVNRYVRIESENCQFLVKLYDYYRPESEAIRMFTMNDNVSDCTHDGMEKSEQINRINEFTENETEIITRTSNTVLDLE